MNTQLEIQEEIDSLKRIDAQLQARAATKEKAREVLSLIRQFNHYFERSYKHAAPYYLKNGTNEIYVSDGIEELEQYVIAKLKQKDDHYFSEGLVNIEKGITGIIQDLQELLKEK